MKWLGGLAEFWNFLCQVFNLFSTLFSVTEWKFVGILEKVNNGAFKKSSGVKNNYTTPLFRDAQETLKESPSKVVCCSLKIYKNTPKTYKPYFFLDFG